MAGAELLISNELVVCYQEADAHSANTAKLSDVMADVKPPERLMRLFSLMREAKTQRHYLHWDKLRRYSPPEGMNHREWWLVQKLSRMDALKPIPLKGTSQGEFQFAVMGG